MEGRSCLPPLNFGEREGISSWPCFPSSFPVCVYFLSFSVLSSLSRLCAWPVWCVYFSFWSYSLSFFFTLCLSIFSLYFRFFFLFFICLLSIFAFTLYLDLFHSPPFSALCWVFPYPPFFIFYTPSSSSCSYHPRYLWLIADVRRLECIQKERKRFHWMK